MNEADESDNKSLKSLLTNENSTSMEFAESLISALRQRPMAIVRSFTACRMAFLFQHNQLLLIALAV